MMNKKRLKFNWPPTQGDGLDEWRVIDGWQIHFPTKTGWFKLQDNIHAVRIDEENRIGVLKLVKLPPFIREKLRIPTLEEQELLPYIEFIGSSLYMVKERKQ